MLGVGSEAPDFELPSYTGESVRLSKLLSEGKVVVLYFYPRAMTPGCSREAVRFKELLKEFEELGAVVLGVSTDSVERLRRFAEKYGLQGLTLLSDVNADVVRAYGALKEGVKRPSALRVTFIIGTDGKVVAVLKNVRPAEKHADEALRIVKELKQGRREGS